MTSVEQLEVLLIDDSRDGALLITEAISGDGFKVVMSRVEDAAALRHALAMQRWDVVICDYSMPLLTTAEALSIVKEADDDLPFIVVSGVTGEDAAVEMMRAGAVGYVIKDRLARLLPAIRREMRDVRTRKARDAAEASLNDLRVRLQMTVERAPVGIVNVSRDGRFIHVNPRFCEMLGYSCDELMALNVKDVTHPADFDDDVENMRLMTAGELPEYRAEKRYLRKDGAVVIVSLNTAPVRDAAGELEYFASIMVDLTEKKEMERALSERDERYRQIVDTAQEGIWTVDAASRTTFVNQRMAEMLGYSEAEMLGRRVHDFVNPSDTVLIAGHTKRFAEGLNDEGDIVMRRKDGSSLRIHFTGTALRAADGGPAGALAMVSDVSARWKAEELVLRQKQDLEEAQRIAQIGSWRFELPGNVLEWSDELYRIWGLSPGTKPVFDVLDAIEPENREKSATALALANEKVTPIDVVYGIVRPDGERRTVHTFGEVGRDADGVPQQIRGVSCGWT